jgi:hypothetical protein
MIPTLLTATSVFVIAFIAAPPVLCIKNYIKTCSSLSFKNLNSHVYVQIRHQFTILRSNSDQ